MPIIQNISMMDALNGSHIDAPVYIQIVDTDMDHYEPLKQFKYTYRFKFNDVDSGYPDHVISDADAEAIHSVLRESYDLGYNVVVSCYAGQNRSGSVAKCGHAIGFDVTELTNFAFGNGAVSRKIMKLIHGYK